MSQRAHEQVTTLTLLLDFDGCMFHSIYYAEWDKRRGADVVWSTNKHLFESVVAEFAKIKGEKRIVLMTFSNRVCNTMDQHNLKQNKSGSSFTALTILARELNRYVWEKLSLKNVVSYFDYLQVDDVRGHKVGHSFQLAMSERRRFADHPNMLPDEYKTTLVYATVQRAKSKYNDGPMRVMAYDDKPGILSANVEYFSGVGALALPSNTEITFYRYLGDEVYTEEKKWVAMKKVGDKPYDLTQHVGSITGIGQLDPDVAATMQWLYGHPKSGFNAGLVDTTFPAKKLSKWVACGNIGAELRELIVDLVCAVEDELQQHTAVNTVASKAPQAILDFQALLAGISKEPETFAEKKAAVQEACLMIAKKRYFSRATNAFIKEAKPEVESRVELESESGVEPESKSEVESKVPTLDLNCSIT